MAFDGRGRELERQKEHGDTAPGKHSAKVSLSDSGRSVDKTGAAVGMSGRTYEKAREVVDAAEEDPETFGDLQRQMDESGKVDAAHKALRKRKKNQRLKAKAKEVEAQALLSRNCLARAFSRTQST